MATKKPAKPAEETNVEAVSFELQKDLKTLTAQLKKKNEEAGSEGEARKLVEKMLADNLQYATDENASLRKQSVKGMKFILKELKSTNLSTLGDKKELINQYERTIEIAEKNSTALNMVSKDLRKSILKGIPTLGKFAGALLSNSNPIFAGIANLGKEIYDYTGEVNERARLQKKADLEKLAAEGDSTKALEEVGKTIGKNSAAVADAAKPKANKTDATGKAYAKGQGPLVQRMEAVRVENVKQTGVLDKLYESQSKMTIAERKQRNRETAINEEFIMSMKRGILAEGRENGLAPEVIAEYQRMAEEETRALLSQEKESKKLYEKVALMAVNSDESLKAQYQEKLDRDKEAAAAKERDKQARKPGFAAKTKGLEKPNVGSGLLSGIGGMIGPMIGTFFGGITATVMGGLSKFVKLGDMLGPAKKLLGSARLIPVVGQVIAVVTSIFEFFDGFSNAGSILDKEVGKLNIWNKISAGLGSVVGGIVGIFDFAAGLFGFDTDLGTKVKKGVAKFLAAIPEFVVNAFDQVKQMFTEFSFSSMVESVKTKFAELVSMMGDIIVGQLREVAKGYINSVPNFLVPDALKEFAEGGNKQPPGIAPKATSVDKNSFANDYRSSKTETEAIQSSKDSKAAGGTTVNAPSSTTVNAGTTNNFPAPLVTRNDDQSLRSNMSMANAGAF